MVAAPVGLEPTTLGLQIRSSILLRYGAKPFIERPGSHQPGLSCIIEATEQMMMNLSPYVELVSIILFVLIYAIISKRLLILARSLRHEMIWTGEELLSDKNLDEQQRDMIAFCLDRSFSFVDAWGTAILIIPVALFTMIADGLSYVTGRKKPSRRNKLPKDVRRKMDRFILLSVIAGWMNSPAVILLVFVQFGIVLLMWVPLRKVFERLLRTASLGPKRDHRHHFPSQAA